MLLQPATQLIATAVDLRQIVIRELAPLLPGAPLETLPVAFDSVPVHVPLSWVG